MALRVTAPSTIDDLTKHLHHRSLPPPPPQPLPSSNREAHRLSLPPPIISPPLPSPSNSHRLSWSKPPPLSEIPEEEDVTLQHMQTTTQYILDEIKNLAHEVIEADARAESYRKQYMETLDKFESLQSRHTTMLQQLHHHHHQQQQRSRPKHRKMCASLPSKIIRFLGLSRK